MGSTSKSDTKNTLAELGISISTNDQFELCVDIGKDLNSEELKLAFNPETRKWTISPSTSSSFTNGSTPSQTKPNNVQSLSKPNWADNLPDTEHIDYFRNINWTETPLGPLDQWSVSLQTLVNFLMGDSNAAAIYWGPKYCAIYNAEMMNLNRTRLSRDEQFMGRSFEDIWPEVWKEYGPLLRDVVERGTTLDTIDVSLFPLRNGTVEETFWRGSFLPVRDLDGNIQGFFNRGSETTKAIVNERRTKTLNAIALPPSLQGNFVWEHLFSAFRENDREFPMAFIYKATEETDGGIKLHLQEGIGLPKGGHPLVPQDLDLFGGHTGFAPYLRRAKASDRPLLLHKENGTLPRGLIEGFEWQGFQEPSTSIALIAINASDRLLGMMVMGLNPRRPYDTEYEGFLNSLARHVSATVTNATDKEESKQRAERLSQKLEDSEKQIREIAVHGPVGMVQMAPNGKIIWGNDQFYELTAHSRRDEDQYELSFVDVVDPVDQDLCRQTWETMVQTMKGISIALRLKRRWRPPMTQEGQEDKEEPVWLTASAFPVVEDGELKYVAAAITDISRYKWAETVESRNASAATEAKRLQENFIDIVSHEMRNPLSAITQLADGISMSYEDLDGSNDFEKAADVLRDNIENAKTILLCAAHQKRIIDDVLTLSKLDSMMLSITPVVVQPHKIVESASKMFEAEFQANDIYFHTHIDDSYQKLNVDWVSLDPSRLTQIFINLITNAIKFTKLEQERTIQVRSSVNRTRPPTVAGVNWFPTHKEYKDLTQGKEWGSGEELYLCFEVKDSGRGMEQNEMRKLFGRFQQATANTHIKYGGSGLGLFISRELTETQGGEIGVVSSPGKGSTFAFYVKGRRAEAPEDPAMILAPTPHYKRSPDQNRVDDASSSKSSNSASDKPARPKLTILLVEDNIVNAKVLSRQLERAGCDVHLANHGMEAIDFLSRSKSWKGKEDEPQAVDVDCVLMDQEMPIMDGMTCTRRIRQLQDEGLILKHINIVAITANARQEQIDVVLSAGADGVQPKPFRAKEILAKVEEIKKRQKSRKET